jgi:hypothetical protein
MMNFPQIPPHAGPPITDPNDSLLSLIPIPELNAEEILIIQNLYSTLLQGVTWSNTAITSLESIKARLAETGVAMNPAEEFLDRKEDLQYMIMAIVIDVSSYLLQFWMGYGLRAASNMEDAVDKLCVVLRIENKELFAQALLERIVTLHHSAGSGEMINTAFVLENMGRELVLALLEQSTTIGQYRNTELLNRVINNYARLNIWLMLNLHPGNTYYLDEEDGSS